MSTTAWLWILGGAALALTAWWVASRPDDAVSSEWLREQIRARGHAGFSGAYHEDR